PAPYSLSLHDALPICSDSICVHTRVSVSARCLCNRIRALCHAQFQRELESACAYALDYRGSASGRTLFSGQAASLQTHSQGSAPDRKSTRLNSSHLVI